MVTSASPANSSSAPATATSKAARARECARCSRALSSPQRRRWRGALLIQASSWRRQRHDFFCSSFRRKPESSSLPFDEESLGPGFRRDDGDGGRMKPLTHIHSRTVVLPHENIDTDRIIPARFLTTTQRSGLGKSLFNDWRYRADGSPDPEFALNKPEARGCEVLVAGRNFGCGSSREHAPWALLDYGIHAVLASEIADIFRGNALKNGLLAVVLSEGEHRYLLEHPGIELSIDVEQGFIELPDGGRFTFELEPFARHCLLSGVDQLGFLVQHEAEIAAFETKQARAA